MTTAFGLIRPRAVWIATQTILCGRQLEAGHFVECVQQRAGVFGGLSQRQGGIERVDLGIGGKKGAAGDIRSDTGLQVKQIGGAQQIRLDTQRSEMPDHAGETVQAFRFFYDGEAAGGAVVDIQGKLLAQLGVKLLAAGSQLKVDFRLFPGHHVQHTGFRCPGSERAAIEQMDFYTRLRKIISTGTSDDPGADDEHIRVHDRPALEICSPTAALTHEKASRPGIARIEDELLKTGDVGAAADGRHHGGEISHPGLFDQPPVEFAADEAFGDELFVQSLQAFAVAVSHLRRGAGAAGGAVDGFDGIQDGIAGGDAGGGGWGDKTHVGAVADLRIQRMHDFDALIVDGLTDQAALADNFFGSRGLELQSDGHRPGRWRRNFRHKRYPA